MSRALTLAPMSHGEIRGLVDRASDALARAVLAADILDTCALADAAFSAGKAAARLARAKGAHDDVIAAIQRAQIDALEIDCLAKSRLADEYDAARDRGEVSKQGQRNDLIPHENKVPTITDIGMSAKMIFEARQIRDACSRAPSAVRNALREMADSGKEPTKAELRRALGLKGNMRAAVGTASASKADRGENFYQTPEAATLTLLALESFSSLVWEPACGLGAISCVLEAQGYDVRLSDLLDRGTESQAGERQTVGDFLLSAPAENGDGPDIVTNPPYGEKLNAFVAHALRVHRPRKMALLLNWNFACGFKDGDRNFVMDENPPARSYVFKRRLPMMHREGWEGPKASSRMNTAWFVWELQADGTYGSETLMRRVDWADYADKDSLTPGERRVFGGHQFLDEDLTRETPRLTLDERIDRARATAIAWACGRASFDEAQLRQAIGARSTVAAALICEMIAEGMISEADENGRHTTLSAERVAA